MEDAKPEISEVQNSPILEFNGAIVENLVVKNASFQINGISISPHY
jgi:hypothetical protein